MILQKLKADTNLDILAKAMKADTGPMRASFTLVREVGTGTPYMVRGGGAEGLGPVGSHLTLKPETDFFVEEGSSPRRDLVCEVVKADRALPFALHAGSAVGAMLAGCFATIAGAQMVFSGTDPFHAFVAGGAVIVSGVLAVGHYIRSCLRNQGNDVNAAFVNAARADDQSPRIISIERAIGPRWPRVEAPVVPAKPVAALPPPERYDAAFLVVNQPRAKVTA